MTAIGHASEQHERRSRNHCPNPSIPGRGGRAPAPDGARGLFGNRRVPARADLQCVGCLRQAALRGDREAGAAGRRRCADDPDHARHDGRHAHHQRHRHRHGPAGADRQSRNRRPLGDARLREPPEGGAGRRRADRPVRRRVLFGLHGGRPHRGDQPPRRLERGLGVELIGRRRLRDRAGDRRAGRRASRAAPRSSCI